jgi:hypothetical protein
MPLLKYALAENTRSASDGEILLVVTPRLVSPPAATDTVLPAFLVGTVSRLITPL